MLQIRLDQLRREYLTREEILLQAQLTTQIQSFIRNTQVHLRTLQQQENRHQQTIVTSIYIQQCLQMDNIKRQLQQIENRNGILFQQAEIITQQLSLVVANPDGHQLFPR